MAWFIWFVLWISYPGEYFGRLVLPKEMGAAGLLFASEEFMRLGMVTSSFSLGPDDTTNAGVFVRDLAEALSLPGSGCPCPHPKESRPSLPGRNPLRCTVLLVGDLSGSGQRLAAQPLKMIQLASLLLNGMVSRYAREKRLEALLAMWAIPSGLFCLRPSTRLGIPYGVWALGSDIWGRKKYPGGDRLVRKVLQRAAFRFADGIQTGRRGGRLAGAPCAFVPSFRRLKPTGAMKRPDLDFSLTQFLFIGRYEWNKGPDILIKAMIGFLRAGSRPNSIFSGAVQWKADSAQLGAKL